MALHLETFGRTRLIQSETGESILPVGKPLALLIYLDASSNRRAGRERLMNLLWGDRSQEAAAHSLRQNLWTLRKALGKDAVPADRTEISLVADIQADHRAFEEAAAKGDAESCLSLYGGDFLEDLAVQGGLEFDQWATICRQRLREMLVEVVENSANALMNQAQSVRAERIASDLRDRLPEDQRAWRLLVRAAIAAGDHEKAQRYVDELDDLLAETGETMLPGIAALVAGPVVSTAAITRPKREMVGRASEFALLLKTWGSVQERKSGRIRNVLGPAGIGKSTLINAFVDRATAAGSRVVSVTASWPERTLGHGFVARLVEALIKLPGATGIAPTSARSLVSISKSAAELFDVSPDTTTGEGAEKNLTVAVSDLLDSVLEEGPVLLAVDNAHWIDSPSVEILRFAVAKNREGPLLLVLGSRPNSYPVLSGFDQEVLHLEGFSESEIVDLLVSEGSLPDEPWADSLPGNLRRITDGNPLLVSDSIRLLTERGALTLDSTGTWQLTDEAAYDTVLMGHGAVSERIGSLNQTELDIVALLALSKSPINAEDLARLLNLEELKASELVKGLEGRGLINETPGGLAIGHDVIGASALDASDARIGALNGALGRLLLEKEPPDPTDLRNAGHHLAEAGDTSLARAAFVKWARGMRSLGHRAATRELKKSFTAGSESINLGRLSLWDRLLVAPRHVRAIGLAACVLPIAPLAWLTQSESPRETVDAILIGTHQEGFTQAVYVSNIVRSEFDRSTSVIPLGEEAESVFVIGETRGMDRNPTNGAWVVASRGVSLIDPVRSRKLGSTAPRLYTGESRDPAWSPDGEEVAFVLSDSVRSDSASVVTLSTDGEFIDVLAGRRGASAGARRSELRFVTTSGTVAGAPRWNQTTGQLAVVVEWVDSTRLCTTRTSELTPSCVATDPTRPVAVVGWRGRSELVFVGQVDGDVAIYSLRLPDGTPRRVGTHAAIKASMSPDGAWTACLCETANGPEWILFRTDTPERFRRIDVAIPEEWNFSFQSSQYDAHLRDLVVTAPRALAGVPTPADAIGVMNNGESTAVDVNWDGAWTFGGEGRVISDSAGGIEIQATTTNLRAIKPIQVEQRESEHQLSKDWSQVSVVAGGNWHDLGRTDPDWLSFGHPAAAVGTANTNGSVGIGFTTNANTMSGVVTKNAIEPLQESVGAYLTFDFTSSEGADSIVVQLTQDYGDDAISNWQPITAWPTDPNLTWSSCSFVIVTRPNGLTPTIISGGSVHDRDIPQLWKTDRPITLTLQVTPGGSCHLGNERTIVNSKSIRNFQEGMPFRLLIMGHSPSGEVRLLGTEIWSGVPDFLSWHYWIQQRQWTFGSDTTRTDPLAR